MLKFIFNIFAFALEQEVSKVPNLFNNFKPPSR